MNEPFQRKGRPHQLMVKENKKRTRGSMGNREKVFVLIKESGVAGEVSSWKKRKTFWAIASGKDD